MVVGGKIQGLGRGNCLRTNQMGIDMFVFDHSVL